MHICCMFTQLSLCRTYREGGYLGGGRERLPSPTSCPVSLENVLNPSTMAPTQKVGHRGTHVPHCRL